MNKPVIKEDHRVRVAEERRARMSRRLLEAVTQAFSNHVELGPPSVDEVIREAGVSRATFYKYFQSVDDAIEHQASQLVEDMVVSLNSLIDPQMRPSFLLTMSVHLFLLRSTIDRAWGAFVARSNLLRADGVIYDGLTRHLTDAANEDEVDFVDLNAARTLVVGALREGLRALSQETKADRQFVEQTCIGILMGLGLERPNATDLVERTTIFIRGAAPDRLSWWTDPWASRSKLN